MAKETEKRGLSLPLPDTVAEALSHVPKQNCVKHSVKLKGDSNVVVENESDAEPKLISENHAFYVGKIIPSGISDRIKRVLGWGDKKERIYNEEFIQGALSYMFDHLEEGQKARMVVCRSLSEIMNGPQDVEDAMSTEKEIEMIKRIARKKFQKDEKSLEVVDMETLSHHADLFSALRSAIDPETGSLDMEKALRENSEEADEIKQSSSFQIARQLFEAVQNSEELSCAFQKAVPARLKDDAEEEDSTVSHYALIEVAIRLSDICNGWKIQGGSDRQAIYNGIIIQLIKGNEGRYRDVPELQQLFTMLEGAGFETLSLDRDKNFHHLKKIQSTARARMLIYAALALSVVTASFGVGRWYEGKKEKERQVEIERDIIRNRLRDTQFSIDGRITVDEKNNPNIFKGIYKRAMQHLKARYALDDDRCEALSAFLKGYLLRKKGSLPTIDGGNHYLLIDLVDGFAQENAIYFKEKGITVEKPYQNLQHLIPKFKQLLASKENLVIPENSVVDYTGPSGMASGKGAERIGEFYCGAAIHNEFVFYLYEDKAGKEHLLALDPYARPANKPQHEKYLSSKMAKLGAWQFLYAMERFGILPLHKIGGELRLSRDPADFQKKACKPKEMENSSLMRGVYKPLSYRNAETGVHYNLLAIPSYSVEEKIYVPCVIAAAEGDARFTFKRAAEIGKHYHGIMTKWYRYRMNNINEKPSGK